MTPSVKRQRQDDDEPEKSTKNVATEEGSYHFQMFVQNIREEESRKMKAEIDKLRDQVTELQDSLTTSRKERETDRDGHEKQLEDCRKECAVERAKAFRYQKEFEYAKARATRLESQVKKETEDKLKAEAQIRNLQLKIKALKDDVSAQLSKY